MIITNYINKQHTMKKVLLLIAIIFAISLFNTKEITWVAIGDSITYLNDHPEETGNRITKGYLTGVVEKLPNIHYTNKGPNGWTSGDIAREIEMLGLPSVMQTVKYYNEQVGKLK